MDIQIKTIEDLSLNAWPSHQIQIYDGWLLRFSYFYTHRTNCVEQIGMSSIPLEEKIAYCEKEYLTWGTPSIFKISPLLDPDFDRMLAERGYMIEHPIYNMLLDLSTLDLVSADSTDSLLSSARSIAATSASVPASDRSLAVSPASVPASDRSFAVSPASVPASDRSLAVSPASVFSTPAPSTGSGFLASGNGKEQTKESEDLSLSCGSFITQAWIDALFRLKNTTNIMHRTVVPSMYQAIPKETICVSLVRDGIIYGTGLGILDRDHIGVYAIHVHPDFRRRGYARKIVRAILSEGLKRGASYAYLQVVCDNQGAIKLYQSLGFRILYQDWFRVKRIH